MGLKDDHLAILEPRFGRDGNHKVAAAVAEMGETLGIGHLFQKLQNGFFLGRRARSIAKLLEVFPDCDRGNFADLIHGGALLYRLFAAFIAGAPAA
eukprot:NODE_6766_length_622_cov_1.448485_g6743_i0.p1 GENE.NODE_6766_length_622_cov_1.448485_g6743_i0~~NODE_6766_length_622_cov_1.448485_g6743_i0.p1  ORF type:complete len:112 (+),score=7.37 NODE_6766_length_622_cov_1.448485_g6743_i0:51-338(+)